MEYEDIGNDFFRERNQLMHWNTSVPIISAAFPGLPNDISIVKFRFASKMAISKKNNCTAILTPDGELRLIIVKDGLATLKCHLIVQLDPYPEYCFLKWTQSESLLILTQSDGKINVFDPNGSFCYSIINNDNDSTGVITEIRSVAVENNDQYVDLLYVLHLNSQLYVFKLGKSNYDLKFSANLGLARSSSFALLPTYNLIVATSEYLRSAENNVSGSEIGLNVFRLFDEFPYVDCIKKSPTTSAWKKAVKKLLPLADRTTSIFAMDVNSSGTHLVVISNGGDIFVLNVPSLTVEYRRFAEQGSIDRQPLMVKWSTNENISFLLKNGAISHVSMQNLERIEENSVLIPYCASIDWNSIDSYLAYTEQEINQEGRLVSKNEYMNRFWFFTIFRISFIYQWVKALSGALVGEPFLENVQHTGFERTFNYILYENRTITRKRFIEKLLNKKDYDQAIRLAKQGHEFVMDFVYNRKWQDLKEHPNDDAIQALEEVQDKKWVVQECLSCQSLDTEIQKRLISLAESVMDQVDDQLEKKVRKANVILQALPKHLVDDAALYLKFRSSDLLRMTCTIAQEGNIELLQYIAVKYIKFLREYMLIVLSLIPESILPKSYATLIPSKTNNNTIVYHMKEAFEDSEKIELDPKTLESEDINHLIKYSLNENDVNKFIEWCNERTNTIDSLTGMVNNSISLLEISVIHGFKELEKDLKRWKTFQNFVKFSSNISLSFEQFLTTDVSYIRDAISKHMFEDDLVQNLENVLQIFEEFHPDSTKGAIFQMVHSKSTTNLDTLLEIAKMRPNFFNDEELILIFCETNLFGDELCDVLIKFESLARFTKILKMFRAHEFTPTFGQLYNSFTSKTLAEHLFKKFILKGSEKPSIDWEDLIYQVHDMQTSLYSDLLTRQEATTMVASEMLSHYDGTRFVDFPVNLVMSPGNDPNKLSIKAWEDIVAQKSQEFIERAMPDKEDPNLELAKAVLNLIPIKHRSIAVRDALINVQIIVTCIELGSQRLPATYRFCEPENLLQEVVGIEKNYKQVKKCAELAKILSIKTPAAKAMVCCAQKALEVKDFTVFERYIRQLLKTAKGLSGIYHLCKDARDKEEVAHLKHELITCMILNCPTGPSEEILDVLDSIQIKPTEGQDKEEERTKLLVDDMFLLDPMYSTVDDINRISTKTVPKFIKLEDTEDANELIHALAKEWSTVSVTVALFVELLSNVHSESYLSKNHLLGQLLNSLVKLQELGSADFDAEKSRLLAKIIEVLPTSVLAKIGSGNKKKEDTAIERVLDTGIERERFFEDADYRSESLFALISMTKEEPLITDILEVSDQFKLSRWDLLFALLFYLLTDDEVSPVEAKSIMKNQKLHEQLWVDLEKLYEKLRASIFLGIPEKDVNKLKLYLTFFKSTEPEFDFLKCLPNIQNTKTKRSLKDFLKPDVSAWLEWIKMAYDTQKDEDIVAVVRFFKKTPNLEEIAHQFLDYIVDRNLATSRAIKLLLRMMENRDELLIDEISEKLDRSAEVDFWNSVLSDWSSKEKDKYEVRLEAKIKRRIEIIHRSTTHHSATPSSESEDLKFDMKRRKH